MGRIFSLRVVWFTKDVNTNAVDSNIPYPHLIPLVHTCFMARPGMREVTDGKGCNFSSKGCIIFKKGANKNQRALAYLMQFKIKHKQISIQTQGISSDQSLANINIK